VLTAAQRLRRRAEFAATIRGGRRAGRGSLVVHLITHTSPARTVSTARAGFVVSRAVGPAVVRNKVRRRLRHLVRERIAALPPGADLVVRALPAAAGRAYTELGADLDAAIASALAPRRPRERR
jgi:ribonuclease P protein component